MVFKVSILPLISIKPNYTKVDIFEYFVNFARRVQRKMWYKATM